ncbi:hypothetical protein PF004_g21779 [Phytophthora fragariae]|uniref:SAP domain-containing protein n=1 Tax=Phytophthora fragariae TaxID=53985 RepID=A0A6G0N1Y9_9STRA|nr:hypothetical protein PF004_g21779 [Phytophthora fragariae]
MSESDTSTSDEYETSSGDEEQASPGLWSYVTAEGEQVEVNDVDRILLEKAREESSTVIGRLLQRMFESSEHHLASVDVACFINAWLDTSILSGLTNYANRSLCGSDAVAIDDIFKFVEVELWLSFSGITPDAFYSVKNAKYYPPAATVMPLSKYRSVLTALGNSNLQNGMDTSHWDAPFTSNRDISNSMEQIRRLCSDIAFVNEVTIASLDDDMLRLRSQLVNDIGLAHVRNPKKGYGPVHHGIVSVVTGFYLGGHVATRGKVALCYATNPKVGPGFWSYITSSKTTDVLTNSSDMFSQFEDGVQQITTTQRTPDWFLLRKFRITGSVAAKVFRAAARCGNGGESPADDPDVQTIVMLLSMGQTRNAPSSLQITDPENRASFTRAELAGKSGEELKQLCRNASLPAYGTKSVMIDRLLGERVAAVQHDELSLEEEVLTAWFMKPVSTSDMKIGLKNEDRADMKIGLKNEDRVAKHIKAFLDLHSDYHVEVLKAYGLLCKKSMPVAAFSPDHVAFVVSVTRGRIYAIMEYKTRTKPRTEEKERRLAARHGLFTTVNLMTDGFGGLFTDLIPVVSHRLQLLHSVVCGGIQDGFIVYASTTSIIRVVHVFVGNRVSWTYRSALKAIQEGCMGWIYRSEPVPTFKPQALGHCVDQQTLVQTLSLWKAIDKMVNDRRRPLPAAKHILPSLIALWNRVIGGIDVYSRFLKNVKAKHFRLSPTGAIWLRMIMTLVYNAYQSFLLFQSNSFLMNRSLCTSYMAYQKYKQNLPRFKDFCRDAASVLSQRPMPIVDKKPAEEKQPDSCRPRESFAYKKRIHFDKDKEWRDLRMSKPGTHRMVVIEGGLQRCCELCCRLNHDTENIPHARKGFKTRHTCEVCRVSLCKTKRWNGDESCFDKFHAERRLPNPCEHPEAMHVVKTNREDVLRGQLSGFEGRHYMYCIFE